MSLPPIQFAASFVKPMAALAADEKPVLAVRITPNSSTTRRPFHIALLLDTSGSMKGERITAVCTTMLLLVEALHDNDVLTIISYQHSADVLAQGHVITPDNRVDLLTVLNNLSANGGTNLESAIFALHQIAHPTSACIADAPPPQPIDSVFLLTDGFINQGLTSTRGLLRMLLAAIPEGTPVHTLGYGAEHNARMLRDMSMMTRASYTYADASELLPSIVGDILGGLETEMGRCGKLAFGEWRCLELGAELSETADTYNVGTLIANKDQWIVLEGPVGATEPPALTFTWRKSGTNITESHTIEVDPTSTSIEAIEQVARVNVAIGLASATESLEMGYTVEALEILETLQNELSISVAHGSPFITRLQAQIDEMVDAVRRCTTSRRVMHGSALVRTDGSAFAASPPYPSIANVVSRMASNTAALTCQRGFVSMLNSQTEEDPYEPLMTPPADNTAVQHLDTPNVTTRTTHSFCSPLQRAMTNTMRTRYTESQESTGFR